MSTLGIIGFAQPATTIKAFLDKYLEEKSVPSDLIAKGTRPLCR